MVDLIRQSFSAFQNVYPISSPLIFISHVGTHWLNVFAWTAPSVTSLFFRQLTGQTNPHVSERIRNHAETQHDVRCLRIAFIDAVQNHVMDEFIRGFTVFVYFHLLPKFVVYHIGVFMCHLVFLSWLCGLWLSLRHIKRKQGFVRKQGQRPY